MSLIMEASIKVYPRYDTKNMGLKKEPTVWNLQNNVLMEKVHQMLAYSLKTFASEMKQTQYHQQRKAPNMSTIN